jgi:phenylacetic acid degradation operon negative regulatory protein
MAPTIAVSPHPDREPSADRILAGLDLAESATTFVATSGSATPDERIVSDAWQLDELAADYQRFVDEFMPLDVGHPAAAFAALVRLVDAWRRFPFRDPELPADLLPDRWIGRRARSLFDQLRADWSAAAHQWFARTDASG